MGSRCRPVSGRVDIAIDDSTLSGNTIQATAGTFEGSAFGAGVGIKTLAGTMCGLSIASSTITANSADGVVDVVGGMAVENTATLLHNSIISKNTSTNTQTADCQLKSSSSLSQGHNLMGSATCSNSANNGGDVVGVDPKLDSLRDNGGPTATHALLAGSPALDAGDQLGCTASNNTLLTVDQRGLPRVNNVRCDMGAFEK